jgi:short-subunit dehydrogenase
MKKKIVVTGASKGIGKAIALYFGAQGFDVAICARDAKKLEAVAAELRATGALVISSVCDVTNQQQILQFAAEVEKQWGCIDVLVNNAGQYLPGRVIDEPQGHLEQLIETNLYSAYYFSRAFVGKMMAQKSGHIFNISSIAGLQAYPNGGSYSISKFAMTGLSKALREELKNEGVKVTNVAPGATYTDSWAGANLPESRFVQANDIAKLLFDTHNLSASAVVEELVIRPILGDI